MEIKQKNSLAWHPRIRAWSAGSGKNLLKLEYCSFQIAQELRLRDIGGIIVVDFIDMADDCKYKDIR